MTALEEKIKKAVLKALRLKERKNRYEQYDLDADQQIRDMTRFAEREKGGQLQRKNRNNDD